MNTIEKFGTFEMNRDDAEPGFVDRGRVLSLQSFIMREFMPRARTTISKKTHPHKRPPKMTGFTMLTETDHFSRKELETQLKPDDITDRLYKGNVDVYVGAIARKLTPNLWRLTISTNSLMYDIDQRSTALRTVHQFTWGLESDVALGVKKYVMASSDRKELLHKMVGDRHVLIEGPGDTDRSVVTCAPTGHEIDEVEELFSRRLEATAAA